MPKVVELLMIYNNDCAIYTVHDNFITTAKYNRKLPQLYSLVISSMEYPLVIINSFISRNVILPTLWTGKEEFKNESYSGAISREMLHYYLIANIPDNISSQMKKTWNERISGVLSSYDNYIRIVCGNKKDPFMVEAHQKRWEEFKLKIGGWEGCQRYRVHY